MRLRPSWERQRANGKQVLAPVVYGGWGEHPKSDVLLKEFDEAHVKLRRQGLLVGMNNYMSE